MDKVPYKTRKIIALILYFGAFLGFFGGFYLLIMHTKEVVAIIMTFLCAVILVLLAIIFMPKTKEDGTPFEVKEKPIVHQSSKPRPQKMKKNKTSSSSYSFDEEEEEEDEIIAMEMSDED